MATRTPDTVSQQIRDALFIKDPAFNTEIGSPQRKIIDACAEVIAESYADQYVLDYQFDIDSKAGKDLDDFLALFGFERQSGDFATGVVTLSRNPSSPADQDYIIPRSTQVYRPTTYNNSEQFFQITSQVVLQKGSIAVDVPVVALLVGVAGNVPANTVTAWRTSVGGVSSVNNSLAFTGGTDNETDDEFRTRFRQNIFRNIAGTADQYSALCKANSLVSKVAIYGSYSRFSERLTLTSAYNATSTNISSKYNYPGNYFLTSGQLNTSGIGESFYVPGFHYQFNNTDNPATIERINATSAYTSAAITSGTLVTLEYEYCSKHSRNEPTSGVLNRVDVYENGVNLTNATSEHLATSAHTFSSTSSDSYYIQNWLRDDGTTHPTSGNIFVPLALQPLVSIPDSFLYAATSATKNTDYWFVKDISSLEDSWEANDGLEILSTSPLSSAYFSLSYIYDKNPSILTINCKKNSQVGTDVLVHGASFVYLDINLGVIYLPNNSPSIVQSAIETALTNWFATFDYGYVMQISDVLQTVHNVVGVDDVRLLKTGEGSKLNPSQPNVYGIQKVALNGTTILDTYMDDFFLEDNELPSLNALNVLQLTQNVWGG